MDFEGFSSQSTFQLQDCVVHVHDTQQGASDMTGVRYLYNVHILHKQFVDLKRNNRITPVYLIFAQA